MQYGQTKITQRVNLLRECYALYESLTMEMESGFCFCHMRLVRQNY